MKPGDGLDRYLPALSESGARWARFLGLVGAALVLYWIASALSSVLTPIVAALAVAYVLNPAVSWISIRLRFSRLAVVTMLLVLILGLAIVLLLIGALQVVQLGGNIPEYIARLQVWAAATFPKLFGPEDPARLTEFLNSHGVTVGRRLVDYVGAALSNLAYWASVCVLLPMYTFFFLLHFDEIVRTIRDHLPAAYRLTIVRVAQTIDTAVANFFRGRLIVCLIVGALAGAGWMIVSVPYALPLGALAGTLNLIPYCSGLALIPAIILAYLNALDAGANWVWAVGGVFVVYAAVQAVESFVLSPMIEARSSGLHPVTTVVALLIGAQAAGLLGMLLSIPLASTLKSLSGEYLLPEIRRLAGRPQPDTPARAAPPTADRGEPDA
ncbi:MAG: AI-2E family transporter [Phycisphaerae bacterium]|jgi:predicted PurR-regulated permease PerM